MVYAEFVKFLSVLKQKGEKQMKKVQCEICGSDSIKKTSNNEFVCENCGMKYSSKIISNLLVEDIKEDSTKDSQNIQDMKNSMYRYMEAGALKKVCDTAEKIMNVDSENPEAILLYGVASTRLSASKVGSLFVYTTDAIKSKKERTKDEDEFYDFLNIALKSTYDAYNSCYNLVASTYQNSYESYNQKSIQENIRYNEEQFRRAVSRGKAYHGRNVESPTMIDAIGNSWLARMDANHLRNKILELAAPNMLKLVECLEEYDLNKLNDEGIAVYIDFLSIKLNALYVESKQDPSRYFEVNVKYTEIEKRIELFEKYIKVLGSFMECSNNYNTINSIRNLVKASNKSIKNLKKLKKDKTFCLAMSYTNLFWLLLPLFGWIIVLLQCVIICCNLSKQAKLCEVPESILKAAKKKMYILTSILALPVVVLLIWLIIVILPALT